MRKLIFKGIILIGLLEFIVMLLAIIGLSPVVINAWIKELKGENNENN